MGATVFKPPTPMQIPTGQRSVFLAGSIEMGAAEDWQERLTRDLIDLDITILNPRRDDWDASWVQSIDDPQFKQQVDWELDGMERADVVAMYFAPTTKAPITLLELGLHATSGKLIVCCPHGFWRKGNVDIVCARHGIPQADDVSSWTRQLRVRLT